MAKSSVSVFTFSQEYVFLTIWAQKVLVWGYHSFSSKIRTKEILIFFLQRTVNLKNKNFMNDLPLVFDNEIKTCLSYISVFLFKLLKAH